MSAYDEAVEAQEFLEKLRGGLKHRGVYGPQGTVVRAYPGNYVHGKGPIEVTISGYGVDEKVRNAFATWLNELHDGQTFDTPLYTMFVDHMEQTVEEIVKVARAEAKGVLDHVQEDPRTPKRPLNERLKRVFSKRIFHFSQWGAV